LSDVAQPTDADELPRGANVSRDRIVRAVIREIRIGARQRSEGKKKKGGGMGKAKHRESAEEA